ncbi:hypothetical protein G3A39_42810, partial [Paraburkholderia aspalathi]|nr:hypothetical protein [Paraburkholderia aspalathi]
AIRDGKAKKPIIAYVGGSAASAGYWLASQSTEVVVAETAILGSIGVLATLQDTSKKDAEAGKMEFISSNAPGKRTDLSTDEGRARIQRTIDALEGVFIDTVATGRGVKPDDVIAKFGGGDVLVGSAAVAAGMADRVGNFEAVILELAGRSSSPTTSRRTASMSDEVITKADHDLALEASRKSGLAAGLTAGITAERGRIKAILALDEAKGRKDFALHMALTTDIAADAMGEVLGGAPLSAQAPEPDEQQEPERSIDAIGGLVTFNGGPAPKGDKEKTKGMWASAIEKSNARA